MSRGIMDIVGYAGIGAVVGYLVGGWLLIELVIQPAAPCTFLGANFGPQPLLASVRPQIYPECMEAWGFVHWVIVAGFAYLGYFLVPMIWEKVKTAFA